MAHTLSDSDEVISGINVTPLVDVVLVVLIIFIVTASVILRSSLPVELPRAASAESSTPGLITVTIGKQGQLHLDGKPGTLEGIPAAVRAARAAAERQGKSPSAFISADVATSYGLFAQVVDRLRIEGVSSIALDTQPAASAEVKERR
jgi:biopolymer transport protein ExbD